jgi:hypothetical protein
MTRASPLCPLTAKRNIVSMSHSRPASSWQATPGGTSTHSAHTAAVRATG